MKSKEIAEAILELPKRNRSGTLRTFGDWFGRPMDNIHSVVAAEAEGERLVLRFDEGERLTVWEPDGFEVEGRTLRLHRAARVLWEWYSYGEPKTPDNLYRLDYELAGERLDMRKDLGTSGFRTYDGQPAVELIGM